MIEARRKNKKTRLYIDKEFISSGYASEYRKFSLIDIYTSLAYYANYESQKCFPSIETIMHNTGLKNRNKVIKGIKKLEELNIIFVTRSKGKKSNEYMLLDPSCWKKINSITGDTVQQYQKQRNVYII